jgi:glycosyltransferase involved in cell wall biosynthesis
MRNLRTEKKVMVQWQGDSSKPLISICCITYNHEPYVEDALEGFLIQDTDFPFEILIHDDASTDRTAEIIREYEKRYPNIIKPIYQIENQYSKGNEPSLINQRRAKGKYIALCEGDDYWIDPLKLLKQVKFLNANPDCSLCFHMSKQVNSNNPDIFYIHRPKTIPPDNKFEMKHAILGGGGFMATSSMVFPSRYYFSRPDWMKKAPVGDLPLMLLLASKGKIGYLDEVMSVYRRKSGIDAWSSRMQNKQKRIEHHYAILNMWDEFDLWTEKKYHSVVFQKKMKNRWMHLRWKLQLFKSDVKKFVNRQ